MGLDVIIPVIDNHDLTRSCIEHLQKHAAGDIHIIIVDNNSDIRYDDNYGTIIHNSRNVGMIESLRQGMERVKYDVALYMHNDVYIHEYGYDVRILEAFKQYPQMGVAGFFGSLGIGTDGGRIFPFSNMQGKEIGSPWDHHGALMDTFNWSAVLDGLAMIFRVDAYDDVGIPFDIFHHAYDKLIPLHFWFNGWQCGTIGIAFDHGSGMTSCRIGKYQEEAKLWCDEKQLDIINTPDQTVYIQAHKLMFELYSKYWPAAVRPDGKLVVNTSVEQIRTDWNIPC